MGLDSKYGFFCSSLLATLAVGLSLMKICFGQHSFDCQQHQEVGVYLLTSAIVHFLVLLVFVCVVVGKDHSNTNRDDAMYGCVVILLLGGTVVSLAVTIYGTRSVAQAGSVIYSPNQVLPNVTYLPDSTYQVTRIDNYSSFGDLDNTTTITTNTTTSTTFTTTTNTNTTTTTTSTNTILPPTNVTGENQSINHFILLSVLSPTTVFPVAKGVSCSPFLVGFAIAAVVIDWVVVLGLMFFCWLVKPLKMNPWDRESKWSTKADTRQIFSTARFQAVPKVDKPAV